MDVELDPNKTYFVDSQERVIEYDIASFNMIKGYNPKLLNFVGKGVICMIKGTPQNFSWDNPKDILYFFQRIKK